MKKETKEKTSVPVFQKKKTDNKKTRKCNCKPHTFRLGTTRQPCPKKRKKHQTHSLQLVCLHTSSKLDMYVPPSSLTREIRAKLISCSTLTEKKDSFDVFLQATPPRPPTLQPSLCYSNLSGDLFQLLVHLQPLLFFVWLEQILANHYQFSSMNGGP